MFAIFVMLCISYGFKYKECNDKLEGEILIDMESDKENPCMEYGRETETYFKTLKSFVVGSSKQACAEYKM